MDNSLTDTSQKGFLIAVEGMSGAGKSFLCDALFEKLDSLGYTAIIHHHNSTSRYFSEVFNRRMNNSEIKQPMVTFLLHAAERYYNYRAITNALDRGVIVICDRYWYTDLAYGVAHGVNFEWGENIFTEMPQPDLIFYLKIDANVAQQRISARSLHLHGLELNPFLSRVQNVFDDLTSFYCHSWKAINTSVSLTDQVSDAVSEFLKVYNDRITSDVL